MARKEIYFAGGCFWGVDKFMSSLPGVISTRSGYANGIVENPTYQQVTTGKTLARECVKVEYDSDQIHLKTLTFCYFSIIDPTLKNRQGNDIGSQYQTGIYYTNDEDRLVIDEVVSIEMQRSESMEIEIEPLKNFYDAEEYHQGYLDKNPEGYCHVPFTMMQKAKEIKVDASKYTKQSMDKLRDNIETLILQQENGIYVDSTTHEPLFDKGDVLFEDEKMIEFKKPLDGFVVINQGGRLLSRIGNVHLGEIVLRDNQEIYRVFRKAMK